MNCERCNVNLALGVLRRWTTDGIDTFELLCYRCRIEAQETSDPAVTTWQAA